jgi:hypothetical protein
MLTHTIQEASPMLLFLQLSWVSLTHDLQDTLTPPYTF